MDYYLCVEADLPALSAESPSADPLEDRFDGIRDTSSWSDRVWAFHSLTDILFSDDACVRFTSALL